MAVILTQNVRLICLCNVHETVGNVLNSLIDGCFDFVGMAENDEFPCKHTK
jgi:hypothetical protein